jgi:hypothetical protein
VALAVAAALSPPHRKKEEEEMALLSPGRSYTLAVRGVGELSGKLQGTKADGLPTAVECLKGVRVRNDDFKKNSRSRIRPYGLAVAMFVYPMTALVLGLATKLILGSWSLLRRIILT